MYYRIITTNVITLISLLFVVNGNNVPSQGLQSIKVKGRLLCGSEPAIQVRIKLVDQDFGPDQDDDLAQGYTDNLGYFDLSGSTQELSTIDPHILIFHDCNDGFVVSCSI
uniref:Transthyretin-like family protein n=1 Tax=Rhabditophanes sp. KR3021 TaxID=114890 RepID=A0AC35U6Y1_9BILA